ncbi:metallophosphoesterase [Paenibacillus sp. NPDC057967]|uniref:metallophosphoesterase n=1 Tax=Paenibacillus sp. NPDC057967 TaxID=3346293 RepID=UPI0036D76D10
MEFSVVVIPDTQALSAKFPAIFNKMTDWIVENAEEINLKMILHLGDVVDHGAVEQQFLNACNSWEKIDKMDIPYLIVPGNHDYDNMVLNDRSLSMFNRYFGVHRYRNKPWFNEAYEAGKAENSYVKINVEGQNYLFIGLEFGPRDEVLEWADKILEANPDHKTIIITHCYMFMDGERNKPGSLHNPKMYAGAFGANDGEDMWHKSFKRHANLMGVFSGHQIYEDVSYRTDRGEKGNTILQSFQNWQCTPRGGEGRIRILKFQPGVNKIGLHVFNTYTETYEKQPGYEFIVSLEPDTNPIKFPNEG